MPNKHNDARRHHAPKDEAQGDHHFQVIVEKGRIGWQPTSGYNARVRAETARIQRFKQVIGDRLRAHSDEGRSTEPFQWTMRGKPLTLYS